YWPRSRPRRKPPRSPDHARKNQARILGRHRPLLHHHQEQAHQAREDRNAEIRSEGEEARDVQGRQAEVALPKDEKKPARLYNPAGFFYAWNRLGVAAQPEAEFRERRHAAVLGLMAPVLQLFEKLRARSARTRPQFRQFVPHGDRGSERLGILDRLGETHALGFG